MIFYKKCILCKSHFKTFTNQRRYCGDQKHKKGCAYKEQLKRIRHYNLTHPEIMRPIWAKAQKKWRSKL